MILGQSEKFSFPTYLEVSESPLTIIQQIPYVLGEDPREFFRDHAEDIEEAIEIAERDFLQFAEKHLEKFENDKK